MGTWRIRTESSVSLNLGTHLQCISKCPLSFSVLLLYIPTTSAFIDGAQMVKRKNNTRVTLGEGWFSLNNTTDLSVGYGSNLDQKHKLLKFKLWWQQGKQSTLEFLSLATSSLATPSSHRPTARHKRHSFSFPSNVPQFSPSPQKHRRKP